MADQPTTSPFDRQLARLAVGGYDDAQETRTAMMNRVRDIIRKRNEGIPFDVVEDEKDDGDRNYDDQYADDELPDLIEEMREEGTLTDREHAYLVDMLEAATIAERLEEQYRGVMEIVREEPIYQRFLQHVYGISTTLTARLLHQFGYNEERERVSQLWAYAGLAPGQSRTRGEKLGYNPDAKTLAWLCADRIIMQGSNSEYKQHFYDPYKETQMTRLNRDEDDDCIVCGDTNQMTAGTAANAGITSEDPDDEAVPDVCLSCYNRKQENGEGIPSAPSSRGHADTRARRYLAKKFLKHYWAVSRDLAGYDTPAEWVVTHGGHDESTDTFENPFYAQRKLVGPE